MNNCDFKNAECTIIDLCNRNRRLRLGLRICLVGWLITVIFGLSVLYTGKFPPVELDIDKMDFGSAYRSEYKIK